MRELIELLIKNYNDASIKFQEIVDGSEVGSELYWYNSGKLEMINQLKKELQDLLDKYSDRL